MLNSTANCEPIAAERWYEKIMSRVGAARALTKALRTCDVDEWRRPGFTAADRPLLMHRYYRWLRR
jgi:hypothetical protein